MDPAGLGHAEHRERGVAQEHELAIRSKEARGLRDPFVWIAPDRGTVLRDRQIERRAGEIRGLRVPLDERQAELVFGVQPARRLELGRGDVDADDPSGATPLQPGRDVRGPAAKLDNILAANVGQDTELALGRVPDAPGDLLLVPGALGAPIRVRGVVLRPVVAVGLDVIGKFGAAHAGGAISE